MPYLLYCIMDEKVPILQENANEYLQLAELALKNKKYNVALILFFKAIDALVDLLLHKKEGLTPSSHTHRFRITKEKQPVVYKILDKDFSYYQKSYTNKISKEEAEMMKNDAYAIKKLCEE